MLIYRHRPANEQLGLWIEHPKYGDLPPTPTTGITQLLSGSVRVGKSPGMGGKTARRCSKLGAGSLAICAFNPLLS